MSKVSDARTTIRRQREYSSQLTNAANGGTTSRRHDEISSLSKDVDKPSQKDLIRQIHAPKEGEPSSSSHISESLGKVPALHAASSHNTSEDETEARNEDSFNEAPTDGSARKLAASLSGRQLLNQRLQKYKLPAVFQANVVGPGQNQRWKGSFWIKGTFIGASKLERTKGAAKEGAAMAALKWLNSNHYY